MGRPRSAHVVEVKAALTARLGGGFAHPGGRFLSTRSVAQRYGISYQTAHRLLGELQAEGLLRRQASSGSYIPGERIVLRGAQLIFHRRARIEGSFGAHLLDLLETELRARDVPVVRSWSDEPESPRLRSDYYPVGWECPEAIQAAATARRFALCLNDRPPTGLGGGYVDAVSTDDFSGGACAAELLKTRTGHADGFSVLGGPSSDARSAQRIAGFLSHAAGSRVVSADNWYLEAGLEKAPTILNGNPAGIFACNDRLAEAIISYCHERRRPLPPLVGFDNAPVAERLRLTTIGIPWSAMVSQAVQLVTERLGGSTAPARFTSVAHEPVLRLTA